MFASLVCLIPLKDKTTMLRVCGNCMYASRRLKLNEILLLTGKVHFHQRYSTNLVLLKKAVNPLRDKKAFCRREKINVRLLDKACAFWNPY